MTKEEYEEKDSVVRKYRLLDKEEQEINYIIGNLKTGYISMLLISNIPGSNVSNLHQSISGDIEPLINNAIRTALQGRIKFLEKEKEAI